MSAVFIQSLGLNLFIRAKTERQGRIEEFKLILFQASPQADVVVDILSKLHQHPGQVIQLFGW
jgi:hypothetical protein